MNGAIALAGFMMTAEEWHALDAASRALLMELAAGRELPDEREAAAREAVVAPALAIGSAPVADGAATR